MSMCLARGGVGGMGRERIGFGFTNHEGPGGVWDLCQCLGCVCVGGGGGGSGWFGPWSGRVGWCYVCLRCKSGLYVGMRGLCICVV